MPAFAGMTSLRHWTFGVRYSTLPCIIEKGPRRATHVRALSHFQFSYPYALPDLRLPLTLPAFCPFAFAPFHCLVLRPGLPNRLASDFGLKPAAERRAYSSCVAEQWNE